jgi:predicted DNA-binding transcriptional regulator YafY
MKKPGDRCRLFQERGASQDMESSSFTSGDLAGLALPAETGATSLRLPLARLLQLVMILQSEQFPNARMLAQACAVSRRTIYRDLANLEAAGFRVFYSPERQGYVLARECWIQPTGLDEKEALALLVMSRLGTIPDPFGPLLPTVTALTKVIQSLPDELRSRIALCDELIPGDEEICVFSADRQSIYETILSALSQRKRLRLLYRGDSPSALLTTKLALYRLARLQNRWSLVGHSSYHREIRSFWLAAIERIDLTDETYETPPRFRLDRFLSRANRNNRGPLEQVQLRFTARVAPFVRDMPRKRGQSQAARSSGDLDLFLAVESLDEVVFWVLGFGDQVEVIEPEKLRLAVKEWAEQIVLRYSDVSSAAQTNGDDAGLLPPGSTNGNGQTSGQNGH